MKAQIKLGRVFGVEIGLQYSWFVIALLITLSLAGQLRQTNPDWSREVIWLIAGSSSSYRGFTGRGSRLGPDLRDRNAARK